MTAVMNTAHRGGPTCGAGGGCFRPHEWGRLKLAVLRIENARLGECRRWARYRRWVWREVQHLLTAIATKEQRYEDQSGYHIEAAPRGNERGRLV